MAEAAPSGEGSSEAEWLYCTHKCARASFEHAHPRSITLAVAPRFAPSAAPRHADADRDTATHRTVGSASQGEGQEPQAPHLSMDRETPPAHNIPFPACAGEHQAAGLRHNRCAASRLSKITLALLSRKMHHHRRCLAMVLWHPKVDAKWRARFAYGGVTLPRPGWPAAEMESKQQQVIPIYTQKDIDGIRAACNLGRKVLDACVNAAKPGITTDEIDKICHEARTQGRGCF